MALDLDPSTIGPGLAQAGVGAATGNPIAIAGAIAGIGLSLFGGSEQAKVQKEEAGVSADIAGLEGQINTQRQRLAQVTYQRQQTENMRKTQQSASLARAAAVAGGGAVQGGQAGSGYAGGRAQAVEEGAFNQFNLSQDYTIGQKIFGLTGQIDQDQIRLAKLGGSAATYGGIASIGQGVTGGAMALGRLTGGFGGS